MAQLDINSALHRFKRQAGRDPTPKELDSIKTAVILVPITVDYDDYVTYWEDEMVLVPLLTEEP